MPYTVYKADGTSFSVPDNAIDNKFYDPTANAGGGLGVRIPGRNALNYGTAMAQNLVQMTANFAGTVMPSDATAMQGQLWFNTNTESLYVRVSTATTGGMANWKQVGGNKPLIGQPLHDISDNIIGYTTNSIPTDSLVSDYVAVNFNNNSGFGGWLRLTSGAGMTLPITNPGNAIIGYAFPA